MSTSFNIDVLFDRSKMLFDYVTKSRGYNMFIIDEVDDNLVVQLRDGIFSNNKIEAVRVYFKLDKQIDEIRDRYCYNILPYKSSFRGLAKDIYMELKDTWLIYNGDFRQISKVIRFISTSDYYIIREYLMKKSYGLFNYDEIPLDPDDFYCGYVPIEAIMDYAVMLLKSYMKRNKIS